VDENPTLYRCQWAATHQLLQDYHDTEWGYLVYDNRTLFELLNLEGAQAGLSWLTVLKRRDGYRDAFAGFDPESIASFTDEQCEHILQNANIVRNRLKVYGVVKNARAYLAMQREGEDFNQFLWHFVNHKPLSHQETETGMTASHAMSKALRSRGFTFVGPTICYAFMQAAGMINDHTDECSFRKPVDE
jgi:DNA-3-methyladenine glycosylase I